MIAIWTHNVTCTACAIYHILIWCYPAENQNQIHCAIWKMSKRVIKMSRWQRKERKTAAICHWRQILKKSESLSVRKRHAHLNLEQKNWVSSPSGQVSTDVSDFKYCLYCTSPDANRSKISHIFPFYCHLRDTVQGQCKWWWTKKATNCC